MKEGSKINGLTKALKKKKYSKRLVKAMEARRRYAEVAKNNQSNGLTEALEQSTSVKRKKEEVIVLDDATDKPNFLSSSCTSQNVRRRKQVLPTSLNENPPGLPSCTLSYASCNSINSGAMEGQNKNRQSTYEIDPVTNTRFYEPHYRNSVNEQVYCLSQVTQIGEKICSVENKFSDLLNLVADFVQMNEERFLKLNRKCRELELQTNSLKRKSVSKAKRTKPATASVSVSINNQSELQENCDRTLVNDISTSIDTLIDINSVLGFKNFVIDVPKEVDPTLFVNPTLSIEANSDAQTIPTKPVVKGKFSSLINEAENNGIDLVKTASLNTAQTSENLQLNALKPPSVAKALSICSGTYKTSSNSTSATSSSSSYSAKIMPKKSKATSQSKHPSFSSVSSVIERRRNLAQKRREARMEQRREKRRLSYVNTALQNQKALPYRVHNGLKIFYSVSMLKVKKICKVCFAHFSAQSDLSKHLATHMYGPKNYYECLICDQKVIFLSEKAIQQHMARFHTTGHSNVDVSANDSNSANYVSLRYTTVNMRSSLDNYVKETWTKLQNDFNSVIKLDSDSDGNPSAFFAEKEPIQYMYWQPTRLDGSDTINEDFKDDSPFNENEENRNAISKSDNIVTANEDTEKEIEKDVKDVVSFLLLKVESVNKLSNDALSTKRSHENEEQERGLLIIENENIEEKESCSTINIEKLINLSNEIDSVLRNDETEKEIALKEASTSKEADDFGNIANC